MNKQGSYFEMVGWHHRLSGYKFEQTPGDSEGQGSPACCSPWVHIEADMTEQLNSHIHHSTHCLVVHAVYEASLHLFLPVFFGDGFIET